MADEALGSYLAVSELIALDAYVGSDPGDSCVEVYCAANPQGVRDILFDMGSGWFPSRHQVVQPCDTCWLSDSSRTWSRSRVSWSASDSPLSSASPGVARFPKYAPAMRSASSLLDIMWAAGAVCPSASDPFFLFFIFLKLLTHRYIWLANPLPLESRWLPARGLSGVTCLPSGP